MLCAVDVLRRTNPVGVIGVLARFAAGGELCELAAVLPRQAAVARRAVVPVGRIAAAVVGNRRGTDLGQQVVPVGITIRVAQRVRAVRRRTDIARGVVGVGGRDGRSRRVGIAAVGVARFRLELVLVVVGVLYLRPANRAAGGGFGFLNFNGLRRGMPPATC